VDSSVKIYCESDLHFFLPPSSDT